MVIQRTGGFLIILKSRPLKLYLLREYLILIGIGAELHVVQCSILMLRLVQGGVEAETGGARENI